MDDGENCGALVLNGCNHSPVEVYAAPVIEAITSRVLAKLIDQQPVFIVTFSDDVAALPNKTALTKMSLRVDLDRAAYGEKGLTRDSFIERALEGAAQAEGAMRPWTPALNQLIENMQGIGPDEQARILPIVWAGAVETLLE